MCGFRVCFLFDKIHVQGLLSPKEKVDTILRKVPKSHNMTVVGLPLVQTGIKSIQYHILSMWIWKNHHPLILFRTMFCPFFNSLVIFYEESVRSMAASSTGRDTNSLDTILAMHTQAYSRPLITAAFTVILWVVCRSLMKEELSSLQFHMHFYWCIWTKWSVFTNQCQRSCLSLREGWQKH